VRDAGSVDWKVALRAALKVAIPAGLLCCGYPFIGFFGLVWMAAAGAWAVVALPAQPEATLDYLGAGARIGLVTGLLGGWTAAAGMSALLFAMPLFFFHQGKVFDNFWQNQVSARSASNGRRGGLDARRFSPPNAAQFPGKGAGRALTLGVLLFWFWRWWILLRLRRRPGSAHDGSHPQAGV